MLTLESDETCGGVSVSSRCQGGITGGRRVDAGGQMLGCSQDLMFKVSRNLTLSVTNEHSRSEGKSRP